MTLCSRRNIPHKRRVPSPCCSNVKLFDLPAVSIQYCPRPPSLPTANQQVSGGPATVFHLVNVASVFWLARKFLISIPCRLRHPEDCMTRTLFRKLFPASLPFPSPVTTRAIFYAAVLLGALSCALAAHAQTLDCAYTYASAANEPSMTYCISPAGNVTQFQIPTGNELIANNYIIDPENVQVSFEGYGICNESPVASYINYMDLSPPHGSVGWDAPKVLLSTPTV